MKCMKENVYKIVQNNAFYDQPENILFAMMTKNKSNKQVGGKTTNPKKKYS